MLGLTEEKKESGSVLVCVCVCVCTLLRGILARCQTEATATTQLSCWVPLQTLSFSVSVCLCMFVCVCMYGWMCVYACSLAYFHLHTYGETLWEGLGY